MKTLAKRRFRYASVLAAAAVAAFAAAAVSTAALRDTAKLSGWVLASLILLLASYNLRKKLPFLPLGSSANWLQFHIYAGLLTSVLFGIHVGWRIPDGFLESILASVYSCVFMSGVIGLAISRSYAHRLTTQGNEVLFERIPIRRRIIRSEVEQLVLSCLEDTESTAVPQMYVDRLQPFFSGARNFWAHLLHSSRPRRRILVEISDFERFLSDQERQAMQRIAGWVRAKDDLDYQYALQATLKYWLFVHVPLTYMLLTFGLLHVVLVYAFTGGIR